MCSLTYVCCLFLILCSQQQNIANKGKSCLKHPYITLKLVLFPHVITAASYSYYSESNFKEERRSISHFALKYTPALA